MDKPPYSKYAHHWSIDKEFVFLNHGSFGACPIEILAKQHEYRKRMESQPLRFFVRELEKPYNESKSRLASFIGSKPENTVFVRNATSGVNTVLKSLDFNMGDEIICCNHMYPAIRNTLNFLRDNQKVIIREAIIPYQIESAQQIVDALLNLKTEKTKLLLIDHISSPTGILFPVEELVVRFNEFGIDTLVDGAHAPGTVDLNLEKIAAAYYTGNCHKWICSPKGSAFLYVRQDKQKEIKPLTTSLVAGNNFTFEQQFSWQGTEDPTAYLCVGDTIDYMNGLYPGGWPGIIQKNHELALEARSKICESLKVDPAIPDGLVANLASIHLPDSKDLQTNRSSPFDSLMDSLYHEFKIEVFITYWPEFPKRLLRISPQLYNTMEQYKYLLNAINKII
ncbi:MAG: aminotransferase class V-fold PLP-dependent enzyme [Bacteroidetes bacterium]|nr:aminotransferase class V-fold PLP-dependent enzyme [Bacteroidota bacterium]